MAEQLEKRSASFSVSEEERATLEEWAAREDAPGLARRAKIVLRLSEGLSAVAVARELGLSRQTVTLWRHRFLEGRLPGIAKIKEGRGRRATIPEHTVRLILELPRQSPPPGKRRWTVRAVAERAGVSPDTVQRVWRAHGLRGGAEPSGPSRRSAGEGARSDLLVPAGGSGAVVSLASRPSLPDAPSPMVATIEPTSRHGPAHNLPLSFSSFVGRRHQLAEVEELLATSRLVTLTGCPGVGKSRVAMEVASRLLPGYPDGVWRVELASLAEERLVAPAAAAALGVGERSDQDAAASLAAGLRDRRPLLVLDNCEHVAEACAELATMLLRECPGLTVLATSQKPLGVADEQVWQVPPLDLPPPGADPDDIVAGEAVRLFVVRASSQSQDFELTRELVPSVAEICRRLDGNPLGIELAAARVVAMPPAVILEHLHHCFSAVSVAPPPQPGQSGRHRTLETALSWSFDLLTAQQQTLLRRLSVFAGDITVEAAEEVCADGRLGRDDVFPVLASLVQCSLVNSEVVDRHARYRLLQTVREFARQQLREVGEAHLVRARFTTWCRELVERAESELAGPSQREWLARLQAEHDNVVAAIEEALSDGRCRDALRIAGAMAAFWRLRGNLREGLSLLDRCLAVVGPDESEADASIRGKASWGAGLLAAMLGDVSNAQERGEESLKAAEQVGDHGATARALALLAQVSLYRGDPGDAVDLVEHSVTAARQSHEPRYLAEALERYGQMQIVQGNLKAALLAFEECHDIARKLGDQQAEAFALVGQGWAAMDLGDYEVGEARMRLAADLARSIDDRFRIGESLVFLGELSRRRGDLREAERLLTECRQLAETMRVPLLRARALGGLARVALAQERYLDARVLFDDGAAIAQDVGLSYVLTRMQLGISACARARGDTVQARAALNEALTTARDHDDRQGIATCAYALAGLAREQGDLTEASRLHTDALERHIEMGDVESVGRSLEGLGGVALDREQPRFAARLFGAAEAHSRSIGRHFLRWPWESERYERDVAGLEEALGRDDLSRAWQEGADRSLEEIVSYAVRGTGQRGRSAVGGLTGSELDVARLVVQGLTSRETGERLFISPRTVDAHLARIYRKLGIGSRQQLRERLDGQL